MDCNGVQTIFRLNSYLKTVLCSEKYFKKVFYINNFEKKKKVFGLE